jgi:NAD(P)-dependent dehydrogenase (short-subunit alcohol dehydrogenase family)
MSVFMEFKGRHVVVTGGGSGIGAALVERFAREAPRGVVVVDNDSSRAKAVAERVGGLPIRADVGYESEILRVVSVAESHFGPVDAYVSNAGVVRPIGGPEIGDAGWQRHWDVHVMSHVWATRALLPDMLERNEGYLVNTASAAGLLMCPGAVAYTATKHAAVALAESFAVMYGHTGVRFSCVCPALVDTPMVADVAEEAAGRAARIASREMDVATAADLVLDGLRAERFMILTHPDETAAVMRLRATDPDGYVASMRDIWHAATRGWVPSVTP